MRIASHRILRSLCAAALCLAAAQSVLAGPAGGGGGGNPGGFGGGGRLADELPVPHWVHDLKGALGDGKPVILYVQPFNELGTPSFFRHIDIARSSRDTINFVKVLYKSDDAILKELGIKAAPVVIGMDQYGNEWRRPAALTQSGIRDLCGLLPDLISRYEEQLAKAFEQAKAREEKGDERGALLAYRKIAAEGKKGYGPIATAREKVSQLGEKRLRDAITLLRTNEKDGQQELSNIVRDFGDSLLGARARFALLRFVLDQSGEVRGRIPEIQRVADLDEEEVASVAKEAKETLLGIENYGESLIAYALRKAKRGDPDAAKAILRRVATDFPGLKAARLANEELARL
jgi:hypothetical protein